MLGSMNSLVYRSWGRSPRSWRVALADQDRGHDVDQALDPANLEVAQGAVGAVVDEVLAHLADRVGGQAVRLRRRIPEPIRYSRHRYRR
jgi:hypothetical protein